jgi:hypothetical protein
VDSDLAFHLAIARASHNDMLAPPIPKPAAPAGPWRCTGKSTQR